MKKWKAALAIAAAFCLIWHRNGEESKGLRRYLAVQEDYQSFRNLRYLAFGTSRTWGAGIGRDRHHAFPWQLSRDATNLAIRASGPEYPSLCTYSMVGDSIYDVIVLEYYSDVGNILQLAKRLRQRFPKAIMIFLRIWNPSQLSYRPAANQNIRYWFKQTNFTSIHSPLFHKFLREETSPEDWRFHRFVDSARKQDEAIQSVDGVLIKMPQPRDMREALAQNAHLYAEDMVHWSIAGHQYIANRIRKVLEEKGATRQDTVNPWDSKDFCQSWFETGQTTVEHSANMNIKRLTTDQNLPKHYRDYGKYAMEAPSSDNEVSWITVHNPTPNPANVFARYMAMGPETKYPRTILRLNHTVSSSEGGILVHPLLEGYDRYVHLNQVKHVGSIPPGYNRLLIKPTEANKECPFRITGVVVSSTEQEADPESTLFSEKASNHHWVR